MCRSIVQNPPSCSRILGRFICFRHVSVNTQVIELLPTNFMSTCFCLTMWFCLHLSCSVVSCFFFLWPNGKFWTCRYLTLNSVTLRFTEIPLTVLRSFCGFYKLLTVTSLVAYIDPTSSSPIQRFHRGQHFARCEVLSLRAREKKTEKEEEGRFVQEQGHTYAILANGFLRLGPCWALQLLEKVSWLNTWILLMVITSLSSSLLAPWIDPVFSDVLSRDNLSMMFKWCLLPTEMSTLVVMGACWCPWQIQYPLRIHCLWIWIVRKVVWSWLISTHWYWLSTVNQWNVMEQKHMWLACYL